MVLNKIAILFGLFLKDFNLIKKFLKKSEVGEMIPTLQL